MSHRRAARLGWALGAISLALWVVGEGLGLAAPGVSNGPGILDAEFLAIVAVFSAMGALIASRQPRNPIGWILCGVGLAAALATFSHGYAEHWLDGGGGPDLLGKSAAEYGEVSWMPLVLPCATFLLLLFPDGRLLSPRWRWVARAAAAGIVCGFVGSVLIPGKIPDYPQVINPYGLKSLSDPLQALGFAMLAIALVGSPLSLVLRFRRAATDERQQIKWLALAGTVAVTTLVVATVGYEALGETVPNVAILLSVLGLPLATGIAILRYRLYDIDVVINRTLVYGALTATLAATYLGSVLLLQLALNGLTSGSSLAVAASTLAVAALFRPARTRIQRVVDHRFFRRKYDAARTLEAFSARLRDEVDLGALDAELSSVIRETLQPAHVSLWLRGPEAGR
jgi:multisubunit Na+/H+ antiporter MnhF subunit